MGLHLANGKSAGAELRTQLDWPPNAGPERIELLEAILSTSTDDRFPGAILPRFMNQTIVYYSVASSTTEWRQLVPLLQAAVGSTVSDFTGVTTDFDESDPFEAALGEVEGLVGTRFTSGADATRGRYTLSALARLSRLVGDAPSRKETAPRATGEVLRSFQLAIAGLDRAAAQDALSFLSGNLRLDAVNLRFMTVRLHAEFREWDELYRLDFFSALCKVRRSSAVTNAMAEALYRAKLLPAELEHDPAKALETFKQDIAGNSGSLFTKLPPNPSPATGKAFALSALAANPIDQALLTALEAEAERWNEEDAAYLRELVQLFSLSVPGPAVELVDPLAFLNDPDSPVTVERAMVGLHGVVLSEDLDSVQLALGYVERLDTDERTDLLHRPVYRAIHDDLLIRVGGASVPSSWVQWLERLALEDSGQTSAWAEAAIQEWPVEEHLAGEADVDQLVEAINNVPPAAQDRLLDTLPFMVSWVTSDPRWPYAQAEPLYSTLFDLLTLLLGSGWRREAASAARVLLDGMLELGPNAPRYTSLVQDAIDVLPQEAGTADIEGLFDLVELVVTHSCPNPDARQRLWSRVYAALAPLTARMSLGERALGRNLATVFAMPEVFEDPAEATPEEIDLRGRLRGKVIAIYTLTESVGKRARSLVESTYEDVTVRLNHSKVAGPELDELARNADVFLVCWRSAAHAATDRIKHLRPPEAVTLMAEGKGSSSILRRLSEWLA